MTDDLRLIRASTVMGYGVVIRHAVMAKGASLQELVLLREQVRATVEGEGDRVEGLNAPEREITRPTAGGGLKGEGGRTAAEGALLRRPTRWAIHVSGACPSDDASREIEKRPGEAALEELAEAGHRGRAAIPLAGVTSWGPAPAAGFLISRV